MNIQASESEDHGIEALRDRDLNIYSVGISTGGIAEIRMAEANPARRIIATTIDDNGIDFARQQIEESHLGDRIEVKHEDVAQPLPYPDGTFDYIYARLVMHYLSKQELPGALAELHRTLKSGGRLFAVVRSVDCPSATREGNTFDAVTNMTTYPIVHPKTGVKSTATRYFHTEDSIREFVEGAGFRVDYTRKYDEHLFIDFMRTVRSPSTDNVIEILAEK